MYNLSANGIRVRLGCLILDLIPLARNSLVLNQIQVEHPLSHKIDIWDSIGHRYQGYRIPKEKDEILHVLDISTGVPHFRPFPSGLTGPN